MSENDYMQQVMANQQRVEVDLKAKRASPAMNRMMVQAAPASPMRAMAAEGTLRQSDDETGRFRVSTAAGPAGGSLAAESNTPAVDVKITGWGRWKTVIVPPNAHVVHTRRGHAEPLHMGQIGRASCRERVSSPV